ncbi:protein asteroid homolog 1 [Daktulosphaira vitifoliae]|uniref:protein asteroid homolog 1 n=1 Tax=Daktulosphaira vitifoliae TaxID=58002 RepID=UPI0021AA0D32|nr:protein asteroid homolog 1 [Daktulosphaira vitifoliae]XP_050543960.1 protein asteroid homolog 1 [Daktulosphaira vitifoliae]XP_050543961.1 protein asteroid homolog 1 [Daktulosphaira vitifoliae]
MGIPGLTTFINRKSTQYFDNYKLENTSVIIDGYALTNYIYKLQENQTSAFGGDYDLIVQAYKDFIHLLFKCNVTPIFIFDGAYEQRKIETIMKRMSSRIQTYGQAIKTSDCIPYFASDIIFDILNDMNVPHVNCDFEADAEIVALAKLLKCPVISRDSDFYLNTVQYIPLDMIIFEFQSQNSFINCRLYTVEKLLQEFGGLSLDYLPLVTALMGNDYIRPDTFALPLRLRPRTFNCGLKLSRISDWLKKQKSMNSAIYNMTHHLTHNKDYIIKQIENIIQEYKNTKSKYLQFLLEYNCLSKYKKLLENVVKTEEKCVLPQWLEKNYRNGIINANVMTLLTMRKMFFKIQIDDYEKSPYYFVSLKIVENILGLLFGKSDSIIGIGRKNGFNQGTYKLNPIVPIPYVPLKDLNNTDTAYRKNIVFNLIGIPKLLGIPKDWEVFILAITYWAVHTDNKKSPYLHIIIVCAIILHFNDTTKNYSNYQPFTVTKPTNKIEECISNLKKDDLTQASIILSKNKIVNDYNDKKFYYKTIYPFSQIQSCVYFMMILNSILDFPFGKCRVEKYFKGTVFYNLCTKIDNCDPRMFVLENIFNNSKSLASLYMSLIENLEMLFSTLLAKQKIISNNDTQHKKTNKKRKAY